MLLFLSLASPAAACRYELREPQLLQCQPIKEVGGKWTYVTPADNPKGMLAHIFCACETALAEPGKGCETHQRRQLTFTEPTSDILATCAPGPALCEAPCQQLLKQAPQLQ